MWERSRTSRSHRLKAQHQEKGKKKPGTRIRRPSPLYLVTLRSNQALRSGDKKEFYFFIGRENASELRDNAD